ncbi:MAG: SUMF1/EgtB/PvdO family nonheme iron enzyme [Armatimonadota bacterium]
MSIHCFWDCRALTALVAASFFVSPLPLRAQDHTPPPGVVVTPDAGNAAPAQPLEHESEPGDRKLPLESVAPFSRWKHHTAQKPEEALVRVRFTPAEGGTATFATGLVVRCDGFILVPYSVSELARSGGVLSTTLTGTEGGESADAKGAVTVGARVNRNNNAAVPYALIKTDGYHARSLPLLQGANVAPGTSVRVLWLASVAGAAGTGVPVWTGAVGPVTRNKDTFSLAATGENSPPFPSGAIVVDAESGAAVGMVTVGGGVGTPPEFTTFARLNVITGDVGLAPDRSAVRLGDRAGALPQGSPEMVWVPGGPVALDGKAGADFQRDFGTTTACTPGFYIAVQPVTNGEYSTWLRGSGRPLPFGWTDQDTTAPRRRPDRPACGMFLDEAIRFASSRGSRLPTEVEWRRAAYTRDTAWVEEMSATAAREDRVVRDLITSLHSRHFFATGRASQAADLIYGPRSRDGKKVGPGRVIPVTPELAQVVMEIHQVLAEIPRHSWRWGQVGPIDSFRQDRSVFGVRNVLTNAPELVNSRLHEANYAPKRYPATDDPDLTQYVWSSYNWIAEANAVGQSPAIEGQSYISLVRQGFRELTLIDFLRFGAHSRAMTFDNGVGPDLLSARVTAKRYIYAGFRCAR